MHAIFCFEGERVLIEYNDHFIDRMVICCNNDTGNNKDNA